MNNKLPDWKDCLKATEPCRHLLCRDHLLWMKKKAWNNYTDEQIVNILFSMNETCLRKCMIKYIRDKETGMTYIDLAHCTGWTRQYVRQLVEGGVNGVGQCTPGAFEKLEKKFKKAHLRDYWDEFQDVTPIEKTYYSKRR